MTSSPCKRTYKWWETDDKTKRIYTELLAEKIAKSPKKSGGSKTLSKSSSSCSDFQSRITALENQGPTRNPVKRTLSNKSLSSLDETNGVPNSRTKKYTFETVTMDTLAKYEYIKSPIKKPSGSSDSSSPSLSSSSPSLSSSSSMSSGSDEEYEKKQKNLHLWKTYDVKKGKEVKGLDWDEGNNSRLNKPWMSMNANRKSQGQDKWSLDSRDQASGNDRGKKPAMPNRDCLSPKASPGHTSHETAQWMKPNLRFMLMTSSQKPELKSFGTLDEAKPEVGKERLCKSFSKLDEVPEYRSSSSEESSESDRGKKRGQSWINGSRPLGTTVEKRSEKESFGNQKNVVKSTKLEKSSSSRKSNIGENKVAAEELNGTFMMSNGKGQENQEKSTSQTNNEDLDVSQITKRFLSLCEEVEQLEFKMFEFSDDIHKLKMSIGMKDKDGDSENNLELPFHGNSKHKHTFTLAAGKDLLSDRVTARALFMRQYASPSKSPRAIAKLLRDSGLDKQMAEADERKSQALEEELKKINEKDLTDDEIQEVLKSAKAKYIDRANYLEDVGFTVKNSRKKG